VSSSRHQAASARPVREREIEVSEKERPPRWTGQLSPRIRQPPQSIAKPERGTVETLGSANNGTILGTANTKVPT
jgi:hypothetical protein